MGFILLPWYYGKSIIFLRTHHLALKTAEIYNRYLVKTKYTIYLSKRSKSLDKTVYGKLFDDVNETIRWSSCIYRYFLKGIAMKVKEIIVVEGKSDTTKIQQAVHADTIETNGSAINQQTLEQIKHAQKKRGVIIFTDPDYPGERIRHIIQEHVPNCKHAFLTQDKARAKHPYNKSLGIEHANIKDIRQALEAVYEMIPDNKESAISQAHLMRNGLIGGTKAKSRRAKLGEILQIGATNGKQLLKRLAMFQITLEEFERAMNHVQQEENHDNI